MFRNILLALACACIMAVAASCGNGREDTEDTGAYPAEPEIAGTVETPRQQVVLSISAPKNYSEVLSRAQIMMQSQFIREGKDIVFSIDVTSFCGWEEREEQQQRLQVVLMANRDVPDIVFMVEHPVRSYADSGFLADFNALIDRHERFARSDFFEHVLCALEMDGGLYLFPLSFGFDYVGINTSLSEELLARFSQKNEIAMQELIYLMSLAREEGYWQSWNYEVMNSLFLSAKSSQITLVALQYIDFDNRQSNLLDSGFAEFLHTVRRSLVGREESARYTFTSQSTFPFLGRLRFSADSRPFFGAYRNLDPALALMANSNPYFVDFIPLADSEGRLLFRMNARFLPTGVMGSSTWGSVFVPAGSSNQEFVLDFLYHVVTAMTIYGGQGAVSMGRPSYLSFGLDSISTPIFRSLADAYTRRVLESLARWDTHFGDSIFDTSANGIDNAVAALNELNSRPVRFVDFGLVTGMFSEVIDNFLIGHLTPEQAAQEMHNRVRLWLIE